MCTYYSSYDKIKRIVDFPIMTKHNILVLLCVIVKRSLDSIIAIGGTTEVGGKERLCHAYM